MTFRKGATVRYIGKDELAQGQLFTVMEKCYHLITVAFPVRYLDGSVHKSICALPISDFELVDRRTL